MSIVTLLSLLKVLVWIECLVEAWQVGCSRHQRDFQKVVKKFYNTTLLNGFLWINLNSWELNSTERFTFKTKLWNVEVTSCYEQNSISFTVYLYKPVHLLCANVGISIRKLQIYFSGHRRLDMVVTVLSTHTMSIKTTIWQRMSGIATRLHFCQ